MNDSILATQCGYEITDSTIYIGPMRADGRKVADIICTIDWDVTYTDEAQKRRIANAESICEAFNRERLGHRAADDATLKSACLNFFDSWFGPAIGAPEHLERIQARREKSRLEFAELLFRFVQVWQTPQQPPPISKELVERAHEVVSHYYGAMGNVVDALQVAALRLEAAIGTSCKDEGCPHYGKAHAHPPSRAALTAANIHDAKDDPPSSTCGKCGRKFEHGKAETLGCSTKPCAMMPSHWPENRPNAASSTTNLAKEGL
jgi:hypothetical protein